MRGERRQRGKQRDRLEAGDLGIAAFASAQPHRQAVGQEIGVEQAALGGERKLLVEFEIRSAVGGRMGMAPGGDMLSASGEEGAEFDLSRHCVLLLTRMQDTSRRDEAGLTRQTLIGGRLRRRVTRPRG
jgi:hypothetical protein